MTKKTTDEKIEDLAIAVKGGFDAVEKRFDGIDKKFEGIDKKFEGIDKKFEGIDKKFEGIDKKIDTLNKKFDNLDKTVSNLPDKAFVTDKFDDIKSDLNIKLKREDAKINFLIDVLYERSVLKKSDVERLHREFEIFPNAI